MSLGTVEVEFDERDDDGGSGAVAIVRLARPERRNAIDSATVGSLHAALDAVAERGARAVVLTGEPPGFCAGSDLKELARCNVAEMIAIEESVAALVRRVAAVPVPTVAAVEGFAVGGGFMLAAACDVVVAGVTSRWELTEVSIGWIPPWGFGPLVARVGAVRARRLALATGPVVGADGVGLGLVDEAVADGTAHSRALEVALGLASLPPMAVASTKRFFAEQLDGFAALDARATELFTDDLDSPEARATLERFGVAAAKR